MQLLDMGLYQQPLTMQHMNKDSHPSRNQKHEKRSNKPFKAYFQEDSNFKFASLSRAEFSNWLKQFPADERFLTLKVELPSFVNGLMVLNAKFGQSWKVQSEGKKTTTRVARSFLISLQTIIDSLVLISDKAYLDCIGFDFTFVGNPEKLFDCLTTVKSFWTKSKSSEKHIINEDIFKGISNEKEYWIEELILAMEEEYRQKHTLLRDPLILEKEKLEKKQFGNFWKNLSKDKKTKFLYGDHEDIKGLTFSFIDKGITVDHELLDEEIKELLELQRKEVCNRIFKCKLKKCTPTMFYYYQFLHEKWANFLSRKKSNRGENRARSKPQVSMKKSVHKTEQISIEEKDSGILNCQIFQLLHNDIEQCVDYISENSNKFHDRRVLAFERISAIFRLYGVSCKLFGSCASGITIKQSDVDVAIGEQILNYFSYQSDKKSQMDSSLEFMASIFQELAWVNNIKVIKTAKIPIIKLTVNTDIEVTESYFTEQYQQLLNKCIDYGGEVHMDLTIEIAGDNELRHLGTVTTSQINQWMRSIPTLNAITILMKYELTKRSLNETYLGGLNTYCLIVMIVCFIKKRKLQKQRNLGLVLSQLLRFYGWEFNEKTHGIDLRMDEIYFDKNKNEPNKYACLQVRDPLNDGQVMTRNCYQFIKIKQIFQLTYEHCFSQKQKLLEQQVSLIKKKMSRRKTKEESETESGSEKERFKNCFLEYIL